MYVALFKSKGVISNLIRWQTRGVYSHAGLVFTSGHPRDLECIEAWHKGGVQRGPLGHLHGPGTTIDLFHVLGYHNLRATREFAYEQVGKKYDFQMVAGFVSRRSRQARRSLGKWFCSELVYAALEKGECDLFRQTKPWEVSPDLLKRSPNLLFSHTITVKEKTK